MLGFVPLWILLMDTIHILACLDFLAAQATRGVEVTGDGDTEDVRANAAVVRRVIEELAKKKCAGCGGDGLAKASADAPGSCWGQL